MPDCQVSKARLRRELREARQALHPDAQAAAARAVSEHITQLPGWSTARRIALYLARDGELDTLPLAALCRAAGMQLFLPVIDESDRLDFAEWRDDTPLLANRYNIPEPPAGAPRCDVAELDILVMPLVGWDRLGCRLGMGGGFYDRTLADGRAALLVGLAHSLQEVARLPRDQWDVAMDFVVTESALHCCQEKD